MDGLSELEALGAGHLALIATYLCAALLGTRWLLERERRLGRFVECPRFRASSDLQRTERERLEREQRLIALVEVFAAIPPEIAGTIQRRGVSGAEVGALLARLEFEGKVSPPSSPDTPADERTLLVLRDTLVEQERALINAAFFDGDRTSMRRIEAHYRVRGFYPVQLVRDSLQRQADYLHGFDTRSRGASCLLSLLALFVVLGLNIALFKRTIDEGRQEVSWLGPSALLASALFIGVGLWRATKFRHDFSTPYASWRVLRLFLALGVTGFVYLLVESTTLSPTGLGLLFALASCLLLWVLEAADAGLEPEAVAVRRRVGIGRELLEEQLRDDARCLDGRWTAYLIALGLKDVPCWLRAAPVEHVTASSSARSSWSSTSSSSRSSRSSSSSSSSSSSAFSGGGGRFGGGGASGSW